MLLGIVTVYDFLCNHVKSNPSSLKMIFYTLQRPQTYCKKTKYYTFPGILFLESCFHENWPYFLLFIINITHSKIFVNFREVLMNKINDDEWKNSLHVVKSGNSIHMEHNFPQEMSLRMRTSHICMYLLNTSRNTNRH